MEPIEDLANRWLALDKDEATRNEIQNLIQTDNNSELESRLRHRIAFGTAGLRSAMKAGFAHMNSVTVLQTSQGLAQYILDQTKNDIMNADNKTMSNSLLVVGFDARHNSEKFARLASAAFLAKGFSVLWFGRPTHTPMVPFAVQHHGAAGGVMVTASHNPKDDNGYKVYWSNACQIIPPHDAGIAAAIEREHSILTWDDGEVDRNPLAKDVFHETVSAYFESVRSLVPTELSTLEATKFMYTPMHGVGLRFMNMLVELLKLDRYMEVVSSQAQPDPDFPTVPFPNPEEKGALDHAKLEAEKSSCSLILANDPDADRFAAVERLEDGTWHQFTGNQMGALLASYVLDAYKGQKSSIAMLASTVSSRMLAIIASKEGFHFKETLTGFKWMGNVAQDLTKDGYDAVYAFEESIGYLFSGVVWDKDGIAAAAMFLVACMEWRRQGHSPWQRLQRLYKTYGYFDDANTYLISPSPSTTEKVFQDIRSLHNGSRPERIGERRILRWRDLTLGYDSKTNDNMPDLPVDASAQMITCELEDIVFTARGSGTEPKIKLYVEAIGSTSQDARTRADAVLDDLLKEWFKPTYGLTLAGR